MKAYIITRKGFSSGAFETANSNGIGLIKIKPDEKVHFLIHMLTSDHIKQRQREFPKRALRALRDPNYVADSEEFYALDAGYAYGGFSSLLGNYLRQLKFPERDS